MLRKLVMASSLLALSVTPAAAQLRVGLSALGGGYLPISDLFDNVIVGGRAVINLGQEPAPLFGGRVTLWMERFGFEAEVGYAPSDVDLPESLQAQDATDDAYVFLGSVNVLYVVFQAPFSPLSVHVSAGGGIVGRGGAFFDGFEDTTDFAGAAGAGLRFALGRVTRLRFDVRDYISSFAPTRAREFESNLQNDLIATVALELALSPGP